MSNIFLETIIDNSEVLESLFIIDNHRMNDNLEKSFFIDKLRLLATNKLYDFNNQNNILIIYDGNPYQTFLILNSLTSVNNAILFPNYSYLGVNKFLVNCFKKNYDGCYLSVDRNYNRYLHVDQLFNKVYVIGSYQEYLEIKNDFNNAVWIESAF